MTGLLIQDGRRTGHIRWCVDAVSRGIASGVFISPFSTPRVAAPRSPGGQEFARTVVGVGGEVVFDPMTHARLLASTNKLDFYDTWELWGSSDRTLSTPALQIDHIERVFLRQQQIGAPLLAPSISLSGASTPDAFLALDLARMARGMDASAWQSLAGTRALWADGAALDAFVGSLASFRAPVWMITVMNEQVVDNAPELSNVHAFQGLARTIHSLSERSRVILTHADYSGLPAVAAGADAIGSGWDRSQRTFDPLYFRVDSDPGIRIPASYVTQGGLSAVLRRDTANAIERWDPALAPTLRGGPMPPSDQAEWFHHLKQVRVLATSINLSGGHAGRVAALRGHYEQAAIHFDDLIAGLPTVVKPKDKGVWVDGPYAVLKAYADAEGIW